MKFKLSFEFNSLGKYSICRIGIYLTYTTNTILSYLGIAVSFSKIVIIISTIAHRTMVNVLYTIVNIYSLIL